MTEQLSAGYIDVGGTAIHVAELRRYTKDLRRFRRYVPIASELRALGQGTPAWIERMEQLDDAAIDDLVATEEECAALFAALAADLSVSRQPHRG
jgi:hypothetical protein